MLLDDNRARIRHMIQAIDEMAAYTKNCTYDEFMADRPLQHLVANNFQIMGEAASRLSPDLREAHPEIPWSKIMGMRHRLVHDYFSTNYTILWETFAKEAPRLRGPLQKIHDSLRAE